nr:uncharacterized protein LOC102136152 isoform X1 [Macaca fascicularis]
MTTDSARRPQAEDGEERARGSSHAPAARLRREGASSDRPGCKLNTSLRRRLISGHSSGLISLVLSATYDTLRWLSPSGISLLPWFQESEPSQLSHEDEETEETLHILSHLIFVTILGRRYYYYFCLQMKLRKA